jgi:hypothetical protein
MRCIPYLLILVILAGWLSPAVAQPALRQGRSCIEISLGLWMQASAKSQVTAGNVNVTANGPSGSLAYWYGLRDQLYLGVCASVTRPEASSFAGLSGTSQTVSAVFPLQFGVRYWLSQPEEEMASLVPYIQGTLGPVFGFEARNALFVQEARTETAMGSRISAGVDFFTSRSFAIGLQAGFLLMTDFAQPVGGRRNFNGPDFSLGVAFLWGAGRTSQEGG